MNLVRNAHRAWQVARRLGPSWLAFRVTYALRRRLGLLRVAMPCRAWDDIRLGDLLTDPDRAEPDRYFTYRRRDAPSFFFAPGDRARYARLLSRWDGAKALEQAERVRRGRFLFFSRLEVDAGNPPDWRRNYRTNEQLPEGPHWSRLSDFAQGDIKFVWELSRFAFAFPLVRAYWRTGDARHAETFWRLVEDWRAHNPPNHGANWKCGQEVTFRLMAWIFGLYGFADTPATNPRRVAMLAEMIAASARRIAGNIDYALSQNNNHGISEAAGLWTVGLLFPEFREAKEWRARGRAELLRQTRKLLYEDGTFSQHSMNYHRLVLHDCLWALQLGRLNGAPLGGGVRERVVRAARFLRACMDPASGRVPLVGANDGALLLPLSDCDYLDFRPTVQAAGRILEGRPALPPGPWDEAALWLSGEGGGAGRESGRGAPSEDAAVERFDSGGYHLLRTPGSWMLVRCPRAFVHRPGHADLLHVDLWADGRNVLRDGGSYSYNAGPPWDDYFPHCRAHNTVEFDGADQMPKAGRFLYLDWRRVTLKRAEARPDGGVEWAGVWVGRGGVRHERHISGRPGVWAVTDRVSGHRREAVVRWRLDPDMAWRETADGCSADGVRLRVRADAAASVCLDLGWESLYYGEMRPIPVLKVSAPPQTSRIVTEIQLPCSATAARPSGGPV